MNELVPHRADVDSWVDMIGPVGDLASKIARTQFVPRAMQGNPAAVAAAILTGRELNLGPMTSLRGIDIIDSRPSLSAQLLAARILAAGHRIEWKESTDNRCTVRVERADGLSDATASFSMADAQRAGLAGKQNWTKYPRAMLRARALTEAASMACPDVALGLDTEPAEPGPQPTRTVTVQVAQEPRQEPATAIEASPVDPEPTPAEEPLQDAPEALVTRPQMRKLGVLIGQLEDGTGQKLDRESRRAVIAQAAGLDPETLSSANDLTVGQASAAIDHLEELVASLGTAANVPE